MVSALRSRSGAMTEKMSAEHLRIYYARLFPYEAMTRWLSYGCKHTFSHREFSFTIADDVYIRYQCFGDAKGMREAIQKRQPHKIDIGAVFSSLPKDHAGGNKGGASATTERELVFDIDLTDYDDIRTCCSGAKICNKCWSYMTMAIKARATRRRRRRARATATATATVSRYVHLRAHARARAARLSVSLSPRVAPRRR